MKTWPKIFVFILLWLFFSGVYSEVIFLLFPESKIVSKLDFEAFLTHNPRFLLLNQVALFLGTFSAIIFVSKIIDRKSPYYLKSMLNFNGISVGFLIGFLEISVNIFILYITENIKIDYQGVGVNLLWYTAIFIIVAISEEAIARGFIFTNLLQKFNVYIAILASSLIFSIMHVFNSSFSLVGMINILLAGIFFCMLFLKNMNLSIPIGYHFSWNILQGPIFGFSVSGMAIEGVFRIENVTGIKFSFEEFGLEGSIISTVVIFIFIILFYFLYTKKALQVQKLKP